MLREQKKPREYETWKIRNRENLMIEYFWIKSRDVQPKKLIVKGEKQEYS